MTKKKQLIKSSIQSRISQNVTFKHFFFNLLLWCQIVLQWTWQKNKRKAVKHSHRQSWDPPWWANVRIFSDVWLFWGIISGWCVIEFCGQTVLNVNRFHFRFHNVAEFCELLLFKQKIISEDAETFCSYSCDCCLFFEEFQFDVFSDSKSKTDRILEIFRVLNCIDEHKNIKSPNQRKRDKAWTKEFSKKAWANISLIGMDKVFSFCQQFSSWILDSETNVCAMCRNLLTFWVNRISFLSASTENLVGTWKMINKKTDYMQAAQCLPFFSLLKNVFTNVVIKVKSHVYMRERGGGGCG